MKQRLLILSASLLFYQCIEGSKHFVERPIVAITIPKCGTHLIAKCIALLSNKAYSPLHEFDRLEDKSFVLPTNVFTLVHAPYSQQKELNLAQQKSRRFFLYRDPRDQVVSLTFFLKNMSVIGMNGIHARLNIPLKMVEFDTLMLDFITDAPWGYTGKNIAQLYASFLPWLKVRDICPVKFENLIGPQGGGSAQAQLQEIRRISNWLGIRKSDQEIAHIARILFGKFTFREGKIGSWKTYFTPEHKQAFKQVAGQLLIDLGYEKDLNW